MLRDADVGQADLIVKRAEIKIKEAKRLLDQIRKIGP